MTVTLGELRKVARDLSKNRRRAPIADDSYLVIVSHPDMLEDICNMTTKTKQELSITDELLDNKDLEGSDLEWVRKVPEGFSTTALCEGVVPTPENLSFEIVMYGEEDIAAHYPRESGDAS